MQGILTRSCVIHSLSDESKESSQWRLIVDWSCLYVTKKPHPPETTESYNKTIRTF